MNNKAPQNLSNHIRLDPMFHFYLTGIFVITLGLTIWQLVKVPNFTNFWLVVLVFSGEVALLKMRLYALRVQDRVIRLEERLRLSMLLPQPLQAKIPELTEGQLVALRFASDAEVPGLVEKAVTEKWKQAQIKKAIVNWRPDYFRV